MPYFTFSLLPFSFQYSSGSQSMIWLVILRGPCDPLGGLMRSKLFYNNTKTISAFIIPIFSQLYSGFCEPYSFIVFKTFLMRLVVIIMYVIFFKILCVSTWKICITQ